MTRQPLRIGGYRYEHTEPLFDGRVGIEKPEDLAGRTIGEFALYGHDAGVWPKGILSDEYGVRPESCRWVVGGNDHPIPAFTWIPGRTPTTRPNSTCL